MTVVLPAVVVRAPVEAVIVLMPEPVTDGAVPGEPSAVVVSAPDGIDVVGPDGVLVASTTVTLPVAVVFAPIEAVVLLMLELVTNDAVAVGPPVAVVSAAV